MPPCTTAWIGRQRGAGASPASVSRALQSSSPVSPPSPTIGSLVIVGGGGMPNAVRDRFLELGLKNRRFFVPSDKEGHYRFDLPGYAAHRLTEAGVRTVEMSGVCTYPPENGYFSFRRTTHAGEPDYGRQVSAIVLTEPSR